MSDDDFIQINIAGRPIGIIGFKAVFEELAPTLAQSSDDVLAQELVTRLSRKIIFRRKSRRSMEKPWSGNSDGSWGSPFRRKNQPGW